MANTPFTLPQPASIEGATTHVYKSVKGVNLRLHVFSPAGTVRGSAKSPAVMFFYGGGWMIGTVNEMVPPAAYVASRGATGIVVEYRGYCRNGASIVDEVTDAKSAVRWVRQHAAQLSIDPKRIAVAGGSSGGHLALSTAMFSALDEKSEDRSVSSKPDLLLLFYPCVDATTEQEMSYGGPAIGTHGREVSPILHSRKGLPRMIVFQGTEDPLYAKNRTYCEQVRAEGGQCELVEYAGASHGFFNKAPKNAQWYDMGLRGMNTFLIQVGYLGPE
jgi:acetyl esterase/lipase